MRDCKIYFICFLIFLTGFNAGINFTHLVPINPEWNPEWWKVIVATVLAPVFAVIILTERDR